MINRPLCAVVSHDNGLSRLSLSVVPAVGLWISEIALLEHMKETTLLTHSLTHSQFTLSKKEVCSKERGGVVELGPSQVELGPSQVM